MRLAKTSIVISAFALLMLGCAPCHMHHHGPGMDDHHAWMGCGPDACLYGSRCFSSGAVRSNNGVCQGCSGGKWVAATGCAEHAGCCHMGGGGDGKGKGGCCGKMGDKSSPCGGGDKAAHGQHH